MAWLDVTGAMKTAPTAATVVFIGLLPLHLHLEAEVGARIYSLYCSNQWKSKSEGSGHAHMTQGMKKEHILQKRTDGMIPRHVCDKPFKSDSLTEVNGKTGFNPTGRNGT
jgi:hypothetical protein